MVKKCCIKSCKSESYGGCAISFHSFPKNEDIKKMWLDIVPMSQRITKNSVVCSLHFKEESFVSGYSRRSLRADAVPSIFPMLNNKQIYVKSNIVNQSPSPSFIYPICVMSEESNIEIMSSTPEPNTIDHPPAKKSCLRREVGVQTDISCSIRTEDMLRQRVKVLSQRLKRRDNKIKSLMYRSYFKKKLLLKIKQREDLNCDEV